MTLQVSRETPVPHSSQMPAGSGVPLLAWENQKQAAGPVLVECKAAPLESTAPCLKEPRHEKHCIAGESLGYFISFWTSVPVMSDSQSIRTGGGKRQDYTFPAGVATDYENGKTIEANTIWPGPATFSKILYFKHFVSGPKGKLFNMVWASIWDVTLTDWYGWQVLDWGLFCYLLINEITSSQETIPAFCRSIWPRKTGEPQQMRKSNLSCFCKDGFFPFVGRQKGSRSEVPSTQNVPLSPCAASCLSEWHACY